MSTRVTYTDKSGKPASATFPNEALARAYARTVKNARVETSDVAVAEVSITKCRAGTAEAQQEASRAFFPTPAERKGFAPPRGAYLGAAAREAERAAAIEHRAEQETEYVTQGLLAGGYVNDLLDDLPLLPTAGFPLRRAG